MASLGQLAAGVAHEMNTPLGYVASNFETLKKYMEKFLSLLGDYETLVSEPEDSAGRRQERLARITQAREAMRADYLLDDIQQLFTDSREGLNQVTEVVQRLRNFAQVDVAEEVTEFDLNESIEAALAVTNNETRYNAEVVLELQPLPAIVGHVSQINQVLLNLIVNATQAIEEQQRPTPGRICITTRATDAGVQCTIADDGPGIAKANVEKIFDPFFTTKEPGQGTGLGLSVSHDIIVTKHKGQLQVESTPGKGTIFTIDLPYQANDAVKSVDGLDDDAESTVEGVER